MQCSNAESVCDVCFAGPGASCDQQVPGFTDPGAFLKKLDRMGIQQTVWFIDCFVEVSFRILERRLILQLVELGGLPLVDIPVR